MEQYKTVTTMIRKQYDEARLVTTASKTLHSLPNQEHAVKANGVTVKARRMAFPWDSTTVPHADSRVTGTIASETFSNAAHDLCRSLQNYVEGTLANDIHMLVRHTLLDLESHDTTPLHHHGYRNTQNIWVHQLTPNTQYTVLATV